MQTYCYLFYTNQLLLKKNDDATYSIPTEEEVTLLLDKNESPLHHLPLPDGGKAVAATLQSLPALDENKWMIADLRTSYDLLPRYHYHLAGRAAEILYWDSHSRFCPVCGTPTVQCDTIMKKCPTCHYEIYPPIATATIVRVTRGDEILLVRARNFRGTHYGLVAGFLEPGETLEACVQREVMEETGLQIKNIRYFGSQPWPYPCGLMVGFTAEYESGILHLQEEELTTAAFFNKQNLPELPRKLSIARKLIDNWIEKS